MRRFGLWVLSILLTLVSIAFLVIGMSMDAPPPEWSREAAESDGLPGLILSILMIITFFSTYVSWKMTLRRN